MSTTTTTTMTTTTTTRYRHGHRHGHLKGAEIEPIPSRSQIQRQRQSRSQARAIQSMTTTPKSNRSVGVGTGMQRRVGGVVCGYESSSSSSEREREWKSTRAKVKDSEEERGRSASRDSGSESDSGSEGEESGYACSSSSFDSDGGRSFEYSLSDSESPDSSGSEDDDHEGGPARNEEHVGDTESREGGEGEGGGESGWDEEDMVTPKPTDFVPRWFEYRDKGESKGRERVRERRGEREKDKERTPRAGFIVPKAYSTPTHSSRHKRTHRRSKDSNGSLTHHLPPTSTQLHLPHLPHPILSPLGLTSPCASSIDEYPFPLIPDSDIDNTGLRGGRQVRVERQRQTMGRVELREMMIKIQREMYRAERVRLVEKCLRLSASVESMDR